MSLTGKDSESLETEWMRKTKTCSVNVAYGSGLSISVFCLEQRINGRLLFAVPQLAGCLVWKGK